jgi:hypothetical protein
MRHDETLIHAVVNLVNRFNAAGNISEIRGYIVEDPQWKRAEATLRVQDLRLWGILRAARGRSVFGDVDSSLVQVLDSLPAELRLPVPSRCSRCTRIMASPWGRDRSHHGPLVGRFCPPFDHVDCPLGAHLDTGAEPVAEDVAHQPDLSVDQLECPSGAIGMQLPHPV